MFNEQSTSETLRPDRRHRPLKQEEQSRVRLLGISASLRKASFNRRLLQAAMQALPDGVVLELWDGLGAVPPYNQDEEDPAPLAVTALRDAIHAADGLLIATPEYNRSIPGQLKNALDWASRPWKHHALNQKPVAVISCSPSPGAAAGSQAETRKILGAIGAQVVEADLAIAYAHQAFGEKGQLTDRALRRQLARVINDLVDATNRKKPPSDSVRS